MGLAEEAMQEAFAAALESWPQTGIPEKPRPWLISTAHFKAIDGMRRRARFNSETQRDFELYTEARTNAAPLNSEGIEDDRLRLIFTCCHPALPPEGQISLTLREICGRGGGSEQCLGNRLRGSKRGSSYGQKRAVGTPRPRWGLLW